MRRRRRPWGGITGLALAALLAGSLRAQETAPEAALVELRLGQIASRTVQAYRRGDAALLPVLQFLELTGVHAGWTPDSTIAAVVQPGNMRLLIAPGAGAATLGSRRVPLAAEHLLAADGELYVDADRLGELMDVRILTDWSDLQVTVPDPGSLPVALERRRQAARASLRQPLGRSPLDSAATGPSGRQWNGFVVDYSLLSPSADPLGGSSYAVSAGTNAVGGSLELDVSSVGPADSGRVRVDASWLGVWRDNRWVQQLRLGDGMSTGPRARSLRGLGVTNAPFLRPSLVGTIPYAGRLPPGWQVEVYRGGELVAYDSVGTTGDFAAELPVLYGENPVDIVAYGPYGETRSFNRTFRVSSALVPEGRFEYGLSGGACRSLACGSTGNLDFRYGVSRRWTAQAGADVFLRDTLADLVHPYGSVIGSLTNAWTVQLEGVGRAFVRSGLNYEPSLDLRLFAEYTNFAGGVTQPLLNLAGRQSQLSFTGFYRPDRRRDFLYLEASAEHAITAGGSQDRVRLGGSTQLGSFRLLPYARVERDALEGAPAATRSYAGLTAFLLPQASWGAVFRQVWVRGALELERLSRPSLASLTVARPVTPTTRLEIGVQWSSGSSGPAFTLTLSSFLRSLRSFTTVDAPAQGPASLTQLVQGSVLYDRGSGALTLTPGPSLQRSGVTGHVFLDLDGNGRRDVGEPGLPRVRVQVGSTSALSDTTGGYRVWDVVPFEPVLVTVDSLSFESPLWVPAVENALVIPGPNSFTTIDIPLVVGGVIEGRLVRATGAARQGVGGASLVLTDLRTGQQRTVQTFTDGSFYTLGVKPGEYELSVEPRVLDLLRATAAPRRFAVSPEGEGPAGGLELELAPAP